MGASPIVRQVYRAHIERYGEPDRSIVYEDHDPPDGRLARIDIFVWPPSAHEDVTIFSTIGMAASPMVGANHRAELHFPIRGRFDAATVGEMSLFLANLAMYPFLNATFFDWYHRVPRAGLIPLFSSATSVLLHPKFVDTGWDTIEFDDVLVRILNVVAITPNEQQMNIFDLMDHWTNSGIDVFAPR